VLQRTDGATPLGYTSRMIPFSILDLAPIAVGATAADATVGEIGTVLRDGLGRWHFPLW
jgi:hypothetical protein